jgi:hypothetical protein
MTSMDVTADRDASMVNWIRSPACRPFSRAGDATEKGHFHGGHVAANLVVVDDLPRVAILAAVRRTRARRHEVTHEDRRERVRDVHRAHPLLVEDHHAGVAPRSVNAVVAVNVANPTWLPALAGSFLNLNTNREERMEKSVNCTDYYFGVLAKS